MKKGDWVYYYSKTLEMRYKWNQKTGEIMTEDRVIYTKKELDCLEGSKITKEVHELKKLFKGEICLNKNAIEVIPKKPQKKEIFCEGKLFERRIWNE